MKLKILVFALTSWTAWGCENHFVFADTINAQALCKKKYYAHAVKNLPICCVDIFVYDTSTKKYFMVMRRQKPAQNDWWYPGGRLFKGESFFECAQRKCYQECGLRVVPSNVLGVYSTIFPDSEWDCQTHTVNIAVLAYVTDEQSAEHLDDNHEISAWVDIDNKPQNGYLCDIHARALEHVTKINCNE